MQRLPVTRRKNPSNAEPRVHQATAVKLPIRVMKEEPLAISFDEKNHDL